MTIIYYTSKGVKTSKQVSNLVFKHDKGEIWYEMGFLCLIKDLVSIINF